MTWCEIGLADSSQVNKNRPLNEALFTYNEINSENAKSIFDANLIPENGIYYLGFNNYLLSKIFMLDTTFKDFEKYKAIFTKQNESIINAFNQSDTPYLQSYIDQSWPSDIFTALASLRNHDKVFTPKYDNEINNWIGKVKSKLDPNTKLISHKTHPQSGDMVEGARGSSISLILRLLSEADPAFANEQYVLYKNFFVKKTLGLPSISEYPKGTKGIGDIDSGPVILGVGFSGTIVSIGTVACLGDAELAEQQYKTINAFGFSSRSSKEKKYLFGHLPIADAFIAWGRASSLNYHNSAGPASNFWRMEFHLYSFILLLVLWGLFYFKKIISRFRKMT